MRRAYESPVWTMPMLTPIPFRPDEAHRRLYRSALGQYATGVTVITTMTDDGPTGMTVNSFTSVSLDPPLVLWCLADNSQRYDVFSGARTYAINVLHSGQYELAMVFAKDGGHFTEANSFAGALGAPVLRDALAVFECRLEQTVAVGDHSVIVGRVDQLSYREGDPLIFQGGHFGTFSG
ncbi:FMN reductase (NADH) NtaB [Marinovum algicola]|uniref:NADH-FMN oxidoreductase RutF, flavin reductase (DIM6/NTAB) family n=2 Tax=Roseobacteraceae TaxID=2854170 RepID=A0A975W9Y5_9RHOB|nr:NADH-FMN oxidoreductase RutF, flavin reductase (DIM6/NTAB) family [Marinovum algicola]SLN35562.1 FMN reductase (NADH) NtaB [Marinovum algicola]